MTKGDVERIQEAVNVYFGTDIEEFDCGIWKGVGRKISQADFETLSPFFKARHKSEYSIVPDIVSTVEGGMFFTFGYMEDGVIVGVSSNFVDRFISEAHFLEGIQSVLWNYKMIRKNDLWKGSAV